MTPYLRSLLPPVRLGVTAIAVLCVTVACSEKPAPTPPPPPEVYVSDVVQKDVPEYLELVGQTIGYQDVDIRARVEGVLETINYQEGTFVHKGDLLYQIDPKPLEATLAAAKADVSTAQAHLDKATNDVNRYTPLVAKQAVSVQELDNAKADKDAASAQILAAKAAVDRATLDLGYTKIYSPIDGLVGTTQVKPGNFVGRGDATLLTTVSQIDPIIFKVGITEADYLRVMQNDPRKTGAAATAAGIELTLADGTAYPEKGKLGPVDRQVNSTTGTLGIQLIFPNPQNVLRPGAYGRARMLLDNIAGALLVPQRAVQELQGIYSVAVVNADNTVAFKNVKVGPRVDSSWVITDGLKAGDRVVVEGLQRIRDGITVTAKPTPAGEVPKGGGE